MRDPVNNLRIARSRARITSTAAAEKCGVARNTYWRWENGKSPIPFDKVTILAEMFGVSREFIVGWRPTSEEFAELEAKGAA